MIEEGGDGWRAVVEASAPGRTTRVDRWVGAVAYLGMAAFAGYIGLLLGAAAGVALAGAVGWDPDRTSQIVGVLCSGAPLLWIGATWARELGRRSVAYELTADPAGLRVRTFRRGQGLPLGWLGAIEAPTPWPAALDGSQADFRVAWSALRGVSFEPHQLALLLSADRLVGLALRGADPVVVGDVVGRIQARLGPA